MVAGMVLAFAGNIENPPGGAGDGSTMGEDHRIRVFKVGSLG